MPEFKFNPLEVVKTDCEPASLLRSTFMTKLHMNLSKATKALMPIGINLEVQIPVLR